ncbi:hypothetical protein Ssi02_46560 [Sinosporangium siamense]|uniref:Uncharacterized protein n=1 Tax=Sinosporangium siamense TaxID=1367973 RepID=A0A919V6U0_9ACTN|nr:hypothetical protein Ssi02_46560 [Sinosporangium siamense]
MYQNYLDTQAGWEQEWRSASFGSEYLTWLTTSELRRLGEEIHQPVRKWEAHGRAAQESGDTRGPRARRSAPVPIPVPDVNHRERRAALWTLRYI